MLQRLLFEPCPHESVNHCWLDGLSRRGIDLT